MSQIVSHFEEGVVPHPAFAQAIDQAYLERAERFGAFLASVETTQALAPYGAGRFEDRRCPVCGHFTCAGC